jgi:hypothetical protein
MIKSLKPSFSGFSLEKVQKIGAVIMTIGASLFFVRGIVNNDIRIIICVLITFFLGILCFKIPTGTVALLIFLPFMAFIRRFIYSFNPYTGFDPILIIAPFLTLFMASYVFLFCGEEIIKYAKKNKLIKYASYFFILLILQVFNPIQGGLAVGFAGIIYWIIPFIWFYLGFFINKREIQSIFFIILGIGIITALYGLYQIYCGFLPFEKYWIKYGGFSALHVKKFIKAFSTFTNPQEFAQYLSIAGAIAFMYIFRKLSFSWMWIGVFLLLMYGVFMTSSRGAIFLFFVLIGIFMGIKMGNWVKAIFMNLLFLGIIIIGLSQIPLPSKMISIGSAKEAHFAHIYSGIKHPFAKESTLHIRIMWIKCVLHDLRTTPLGRGIGATTRAVVKFGGRGVAGGEVFHFAIAGSCGIPGIILYILFMYWMIKNSLFLIKKEPLMYTIPGVLAIWSLIAIDIRLYSIGPFVCLLWGWIAKESYNEKKD